MSWEMKELPFGTYEKKRFLIIDEGFSPKEVILSECFPLEIQRHYNILLWSPLPNLWLAILERKI